MAEFDCILTYPFFEMVGNQVNCVDAYVLYGDACIFNDSCYPTCSTDFNHLCTGPGPVDCKVCGINSYRNLRGECVCLPNYGYEGSDSNGCNDYIGPCDETCLNCDGQDDCTACHENATLTSD
jgi:hypothetical protein